MTPLPAPTPRSWPTYQVDRFGIATGLAPITLPDPCIPPAYVIAATR